MKQGRKLFGLIVAGFAFPLLCAPAAQADDTELFIAPYDPVVTGAQPNILFIMDTSGSMGTQLVTQEEWDPGITFDGCYQTDAIYFSFTDTIPDCSSDDYFWKTANYCAAAQQPLASLGQFQDEFQAWRGGRADKWVDLNGSRKNRRAECASDRGKHGEAANDGEPFPVDGSSGPWTATDSGLTFSTTYKVYDGNWLNWNASGGTRTTTRIEVMKEVTKDLVDNISEVNVGLMRFNRNSDNSENGGAVLHAIGDVDQVRETMKQTIDTLPADGWTPLAETLYEAGQYYAGRAVDYGNLSAPVNSVAESRVGGVMSSDTYQAPVNFQCQKNYIVLLTDGAPTRDTGADSRIQNLPGFSSTVGSCDGSGSGACLDDMADYLYNYDIDPNLDGVQNVSTYTVGFTVDLPILKSTAERGGGQYKLADQSASLLDALTKIVQSIQDDSTTFTAPSVPVNAFNRTRNLDDVFVSVFKPSTHVHWPGNLKKYRLVNGELAGQDGNRAVDPDTGFFDAGAFSYWSAAPDGDRVTDGGAAHELPSYLSRDVYTNLAGNTLTATLNQIEVGNSLVTATALGSPEDELNTLIEWVRGKDVKDEDDDGAVDDDRHMMGDPLHVRPVTIIYGGDPATGTIDATVYISTNDGYLHAIDPSDGSERWSFIPSRLLGRMYELYNDAVVPTRRYGLDGEITAYIANDDGLPGIDASTEKAYIVFGMRRGGDGLFAIDVTNPEQPSLAWEIDSSTPGFEDMGQTWSRAHVDRIDINGTDTDVVIIGGGYDTSQDGTVYSTDSSGNAVYMINLETGALIWSAGPPGAVRTHDLQLSQMQHSIPAGLKVVDLTGDNRPDRMYVGDMGGRLWRFDIINGNAVSDLVEGGLMATLGAADLATPTGADLRRFYSPPDVAMVLADEPGLSYLSVNIGSGHRANPLGTAINDEFYSVRDFNVFNVIDSTLYSSPVTRADLVDITDIVNGVSPTVLPTDKGWRLRMEQDSGEKVLSESFTFAGEIFFTSFSPSGSECEAGNGTNRLYRVNIENGDPIPPRDNPLPPEDPEEQDRFDLLKQGGIAPDPVFFFPEDTDGDPIVCIGAECLDPEFDENAVRTFWFQDETQ